MIPARVQVAMRLLAGLQAAMAPCACGQEPRELTDEEAGLLRACSTTLTQYILGESACESDLGAGRDPCPGPVAVPIASGSEIVMRLP